MSAELVPSSRFLFAIVVPEKKKISEVSLFGACLVDYEESAKTQVTEWYLFKWSCSVAVRRWIVSFLSDAGK